MDKNIYKIYSTFNATMAVSWHLTFIFTNILVDMCGSAMSDHGPVSYCMDDTKPDGSHPAIMGFILANQARNLMHLSQKERCNTIINYKYYLLPFFANLVSWQSVLVEETRGFITICLQQVTYKLYHVSCIRYWGPGWLNELGCWI